MDQTVQLLQDALRNARTGESAVEQLLRHVKGKDVRLELEDERQAYTGYAEEALGLLERSGGEPEPVGAIARAGMWMGIEAKTLANATDTRIAELVIEGATMGITEMTKSLNSRPDAGSEARDLAQRFVEWQRGTVDRVKPFLKNAVPAR